MTASQPLRVSVWSGPRNISTALMYSFAQRADTQVVDEPFYGHYLAHSPARAYHPGAEDVIASMETDAERVLESIFGEWSRPVLFLKNMTHHLVSMDWGFTERLSNVILIRDPVDMLPSFAKGVTEPSLHDTGYDTLTRLVDFLHERGHPTPAVIDSRDVLADPAGLLASLCTRVGIPFDETMLSWPPGPRPEDGVWAEHWYASVHRSTGFQPYTPKDEPFPPRLEPLLDECRPYYERLKTLSLTA